MKAQVKSLAQRLGYDISRLETRSTMAAGLARAAARTEVATVIDVGASDGRWSALAREYLPDANYLLFEAQSGPHREGLDRFTATSERIDVVLAAAGSERGEVHFDASDPFSGVASMEPTGEHDIVVPMTTVDDELAERGWPGPYLLKLDTHGFEAAVFRGADRTLAQTNVAVVEAYNFEVLPGAMRFHELCAFMDTRGLRVTDLVDIMRRPSDDALWQFDLFFGRADAPEFDSNDYA